MLRLRTDFNRFLASLLLSGGLLLVGHLSARVPDCIHTQLSPSYQARVASVESTLAADLVFLNGGLRQGLIPGMRCQIMRGSLILGQVVIIEATSTQSASLITSIETSFTIQAGDKARVQTIKNG